jgi:hypothetical protein
MVACWYRSSDGRKLRFNAIDYVDHVRSRQPEDEKDHGRLAIHKACRPKCLHGICDIRDIADSNDGTFVRPDDQRRIVLCLRYLVIRRDVHRGQAV